MGELCHSLYGRSDATNRAAAPAAPVVAAAQSSSNWNRSRSRVAADSFRPSLRYVSVEPHVVSMASNAADRYSARASKRGRGVP